jgi:hypothetical protein
MTCEFAGHLAAAVEDAVPDGPCSGDHVHEGRLDLRVCPGLEPAVGVDPESLSGYSGGRRGPQVAPLLDTGTRGDWRSSSTSIRERAASMVVTSASSPSMASMTSLNSE